MERVYSSHNQALAHHVKNLLELEGIECEIRRELLGGGAGGIVPTEAWVEVWVDPEKSEQAWKIVNAVIAEEEPEGEKWECSCGEQLGAQFTSCWNCGAERNAPTPEEPSEESSEEPPKE